MRRFLMLVVCLLSASACGGDDSDDAGTEPTGDVDCQTGAIPTFAQVTAFQEVCTNCHSSTLSGGERNGAPEGYDFDVYASAEDEAGEIAEEVMEGEMPPAYAGYTLTQAQKTTLYRWALCGTPE